MKFASSVKFEVQVQLKSLFATQQALVDLQQRQFELVQGAVEEVVRVDELLRTREQSSVPKEARRLLGSIERSMERAVLDCAPLAKHARPRLRPSQ